MSTEQLTAQRRNELLELLDDTSSADRTSRAAGLRFGDLAPSDSFLRRHIGPNAGQIVEMLDLLGEDSLESLIQNTVPASIRMEGELQLGGPRGESELLEDLKSKLSRNNVYRSFIGMGYYGTITPPVIQRNILENPGWYTQYTPYQAEISQGRLEALLNFQTMVCDLTGMQVANSSMLDEGTAAAEAANLCFGVCRGKKNKFFISDRCHPQTIAIMQTRANGIGLDLVIGDILSAEFSDGDYCGAIAQYPDSLGRIENFEKIAQQIHQQGGLFVVAADLLALTMLREPGDFGADVVVGSAQRFGVPMGFGGPHAGYMATREKYIRKLPGRIVGISKDSQGDIAYRLAIQTREQHIKRDKATSNICTAQVLLAIMAGMYASYHGPRGLKRIADRVHGFAQLLKAGLNRLTDINVVQGLFFDTLEVHVGTGRADYILGIGVKYELNLRKIDDDRVGVSVDEITSRHDINTLIGVFNGGEGVDFAIDDLINESDFDDRYPKQFVRSSDFMQHPVFNHYHSETEMLRYLHRLQSRDLSLTTSMIPLGSCTMKLNGTSEMLPVTWDVVGGIHPFVPEDQVRGYLEMISELEIMLAQITGFAGTTLQPNAGSQGEYAGLLAIAAYHQSRGQGDRNICIIPISAHGTNPASAVVAGMRVVTVKCDTQGNVDVDDLREKCQAHQNDLAAIMITYPSTHGVFEESIKEICDIVHQFGGQVYMDGANMNAQVGLCRPGDIGADVCHLNLHKTFCIPHGGGGPGVGPICVAQHLLPFLPSHPLTGPGTSGGQEAMGLISAAGYGSASILPISYLYIMLMGAGGLKLATQVAILNANYIAQRLKDSYQVLYTGVNGRVAHELIIECRHFEKLAGIKVEDIAKRLMDYGFHAPTMSFPVPGTLMIEPTESESKGELDRFCDAMIQIRNEIQEIQQGQADPQNNVLKSSPHTAKQVCADTWDHPYSRQKAAYPLDYLKAHKFWPHVARIDNPYGDRNLVCNCPPITQYV